MSELEKQKKRYAVKKAKNRLFKIIMICIIALGLILCISPYIMNHVVMPYSIEKANESALKVNAEQIKANRERIAKGYNSSDIHESNSKESQTQSEDNIRSENSYESSSDDSNISYDPMNIRSVDRVPIDVEVNRNYLVSQLVIPSVGLNIPVLEGLTNENLNVASGTMKPGQTPGKGNYAIAGHHMLDENLLFTPLMRVQKFDSVYLTDKEYVYEYVVTDTFIVPPTEGQVIDDSQGAGIITLVTCSDPAGTNRWIVRGKFLKSYRLDKASQLVKSYIQI